MGPWFMLEERGDNISIIQMIPVEAQQKPRKRVEPPIPLSIAVDFDGTLCANRWPEIGPAKQPVIDWLILQKQKDVKLILWTMRTGDKLAEAVAWCREQGLEFDAVNDNLPEVQARYGDNPRKVFATYYLDDRNI